MGKKKGARAAQGKARREQRDASPAPDPKAAICADGPIILEDGRRVHHGLVNLGNTCFMNSILQCLNVSTSFSDEFMGLSSEGLDGVSGCLSTVFRGIRGLETLNGKGGGYSPKQLLTTLASRFPWYRGHAQHDAQEFLRTLLGTISDEKTVEERKAPDDSNEPRPSQPTPAGSIEECIWKNFRGRFCSAVLCWSCNRVSFRLEPFLDVSLDLPAANVTRVSPGPLGVTAAAVNGSILSTVAASAADNGTLHADVETEELVVSKSDRKAQRKRERAEAAAAARAAVPAQPKPAAQKPMGVWAAKANKAANAEQTAKALVEEITQNALDIVHSMEIARIILPRIFSRILLKDVEPQQDGSKQDDSRQLNSVEEESKEEESREDAVNDDDVAHFEIELARQSDKSAPWGFKWNEPLLKEGTLVVTGIGEDSILDRWNMKKRTLGDEDLVVCRGDRLINVNGETDAKEMRKCLKTESKIVLILARNAEKTIQKPVRSAVREESDEEALLKVKIAEERDERRKHFCQEATQCSQALPAELQKIFDGRGPLEKEPNCHLQLEDCLHQFAAVEAIEDDFSPSYSCPECKKKDGNKTFASRRMWLWPRSLPPVLTLHLKRFRRYTQKYEKSQTSVKLPAQLDFSQYVISESEIESLKPHAVGSAATEAVAGFTAENGNKPEFCYELYGICVHEGSMENGHYTAYVNSGASLDSEQWFGISDTKLTSCSRADVLKKEAYIAFYRRVCKHSPQTSPEGDETCPEVSLGK